MLTRSRKHVPSVFVTALRSNGYVVVTANSVFGEGTDDRRLLEYCGEAGHVFVTHDKTDVGGAVGDSVDHAGIVIYTDPVFPRADPNGAVRSIERILEH
ncbi:DUF5615 family PIN-like protein [Halovivax cerinus]|uniref:DUF5615 family PIN-like protein n=1 Tax=Halovivax cerinus TaxID=1487865 RepID=A0ABD5NPW4_9EURY|nr:DUF5615 family PIN-like protein [Halovivax cerinus]